MLSLVFSHLTHTPIVTARDDPTKRSTEQVPAPPSTTPPDPLSPAATGDLPLADELPTTRIPSSRVRIIEPIVVPPRPLQQAPPLFVHSPTPALPTPPQSQPTQDPIDEQGMSVGCIILPPGLIFFFFRIIFSADNHQVLY